MPDGAWNRGRKGAASRWFKMTYNWVALAKMHKNKHRPCGRPAKNGYWKICKEKSGYSATNTSTGVKISTVSENRTFWLVKSTPGDCPNYVALELREMNEKLGMTFYLDKVRLYGKRKKEL